jgi:hypothetical protein
MVDPFGEQAGTTLRSTKPQVTNALNDGVVVCREAVYWRGAVEVPVNGNSQV